MLPLILVLFLFAAPVLGSFGALLLELAGLVRLFLFPQLALFFDLGLEIVQFDLLGFQVVELFQLFLLELDGRFDVLELLECSTSFADRSASDFCTST